MSKIYHFGDSYSMNINNFKVKHFGQIISESLGYDYASLGYGGASNEQIFNTILENLSRFKRGDILFVNFSFFQRGSWYDIKNKRVSSTNIFYGEMYLENHFDLAKSFGLKEGEKIVSLLDYYLTHTEDYARRIFNPINSLFKYIQSLGIRIFYIHIDYTNFSDDLLKCGTNIKFKNGFGKWLLDNGLHNEQEVHYTEGIQPVLADAILRKTDNLNNISKVIEIKNTDLDFSKKIIKDKISFLI